MAIMQIYDHRGVLRRAWDEGDLTRIEYDESGAVVSTRTFETVEALWAEFQVEQAAVATELATRRAAVKLVITDLQAEKTRCQTVIDKTNANITAGDTKDVARAAKRIADAAIDIARLLDGRI